MMIPGKITTKSTRMIEPSTVSAHLITCNSHIKKMVQVMSKRARFSFL